MAKKEGAELHTGYYSSMAFGIVVSDAVKRVRVSVGELKTSKKLDEFALGAIHALAKLCKGETMDMFGLYKIEAAEWQVLVKDWLARVQKKIPAESREAYVKNVEADLALILKAASEMPEFMWRKDALARTIQVSFPSQAALDAAMKAAEKKHPVDLGSALGKYLDKCIADLTGGKPAAAADAESDEDEEEADETDEVAVGQTSVSLQLSMREDGSFSLSTTDFEPFSTAAFAEEEQEVTAYALETGIERFLKKVKHPLRKAMSFDSESSLFSASSDDLEAIKQLAGIVVEFAAKEELREEYMRVDDA